MAKTNLDKMKTVCMSILFALIGCKGDPSATQQNMGGISSGGTFAVGLPPETKLFVQEYWHNGTPSYLVYNQNIDTREINIHQIYTVESNPNSSHIEIVKGNHLAGPWSLNANSFSHFDILGFLVPSWQFGDALLGVFLDPDKNAGSLFPPISSDGSLFQPTSYTTIYGMNGLDYMRRTTAWIEANSMQVSSQEDFDITLKVTGDFVSVQFQKIVSPNYLSIPALEVISASSADLRVEDTGDHIFIYRDSASVKDVHSVSIQLRAPNVTSPTMSYLDGFRCEKMKDTECIGGHSFPRGILVVP